MVGAGHVGWECQTFPVALVFPIKSHWGYLRHLAQCAGSAVTGSHSPTSLQALDTA